MASSNGTSFRYQLPLAGKRRTNPVDEIAEVRRNAGFCFRYRRVRPSAAVRSRFSPTVGLR